MNNRLEFDSIQLSFGERKLLASIYMCCETGQITGLLGRNGSGKSTLMKIVFGAIPLEQKSVRINDRSLGMSYLSQNVIAYLPQTHLIPEYLTIRQALSLFNIAEETVTASFQEAETMMALKPRQLSGGYRRLLEILIIINSSAPFCLLDEPFSGLMPLYIERVKEILRNVKAKKGIVITDHLHRHITEISDKLYVLVNGQTYLVKHKEQLVTFGYLSAL